MPRKIDLKRLLRREVGRNARVLVVGPGEAHQDPSTFYLNNRVKKNGLLLALDLPNLRHVYPENKKFTKPGAKWAAIPMYGGARDFLKSWPNRKPPQVIGGRAGRLPVKTENFDIVYDHSTLPFAAVSDQPGKIVREYLRVLKPGGKLIITVGNPTAKRKQYDFLKRFVSMQKDRVSVRILPVHERGFETKFRTPRHSAGAGFIIEKTA